MKPTVLVATMLSLVSPLFAGPQNARLEPVFQVASVKPSAPSNSWPRPNATLEWRPGRFTATRLTLPFLIADAYHIPRYRIEGAPGWMQSEQFDITATFAEGAGPDVRRAMSQALLRDRFAFAAHTDKRETRVYNLVMAREERRFGPRLTRPDDTVDCARIQAARRDANPKAPYAAKDFLAAFENGPDISGPICDSNSVRRFFPGGGSADTAWGSRQPIAYLAEYLTSVVERPVLDRTGLTGEFDFRLEHSRPSLSTPTGADADTPQLRNVGPPLFTALQEQLGLKLEAAEGPVEFLIIDRVQRPTPN
ncbi:MAG: TIGR03435 family protein [Vicinamibacterales bacterium]